MRIYMGFDTRLRVRGGSFLVRDGTAVAIGDGGVPYKGVVLMMWFPGREGSIH